jgi:5-methyltetrahydrofolate--homocysteine methyltransferase
LKVINLSFQGGFYLYKGFVLKKRKDFTHPYLDALGKKVLVFDGAMGTNLENQRNNPGNFARNVIDNCIDHLNLSNPQAVEAVHKSFLEAGVDVIETNTFRSNRFALGEFGLAEEVREINLAGAAIARKLADQYSTPEHPRFVAGSMGPTGILLSMTNEQANFDEISFAFYVQASGLIAGNVDLLILETQHDILEVKAAIIGIHQAFKASARSLPLQVQMTLDANGLMLLGTDITAAIVILEGMGIDVIGINCSTGPKTMHAVLGELSRNSRLPISYLPNAGIPEIIEGKAVYPLQPDDFAEIMAAYTREFGLNAIGGCCGTTPEHLRLLVKKLKNRTPKKRNVIQIPRLASAFHTVNMQQVPAPLLIGERLNTQGSRRFKELMLAGDYNYAISLASEQVNSGAHALDIATALTENAGEKESMAILVNLISSRVNAPLVIDSTDPTVMEATLKAAPGRCLLNSIHLEGDNSKAHRVLSLAREFNAAVIALTIDQNGMAKSAEDKLVVARKIFSIAVDEYGMDAGDLVFDPLTFTLASGSTETADAGIHTLEGIKLIKKALPGVLTSLGISNISYGLKPPARAVLNSVFLYHAVAAGLDMAIINPAQLKPLTSISEKELTAAEDLIFNRNPQALIDFAALFPDDKPGQIKEKKKSPAHLPINERIRQRILLREALGIVEDIDAYIHSGGKPEDKAVELLNQVLLPAMKTVGEQFAQGELILPFVLQSAEIMQAATDHLEIYMPKNSKSKKGRLILATVYGDVHDIGKNLVKTILINNGYEVVDLGKQVPVETIVARALEEKADAIGLSALLVSTSLQMQLVVEELDRRGLNIPILVGGAAINQAFADRIEKLPGGRHYSGGVHYCKDAFDALNALEEKLVPKGQSSEPIDEKPERKMTSSTIRSIGIKAAIIPEPPFWGARLIDKIALDELFSLINTNALFRNSWGAGNAKGEKWDKYRHDFEVQLILLKDELSRKPWLSASALYGYFPCQSDGDALVIFNHDLQEKTEIARFNLPRQAGGEHLCLADYFLPISSNKMDVASFQIVTLGVLPVEHVHKLQAAGEIAEAFYHHGLSVQLTENAAVWTHRHINRELKLTFRQGKRYSWGYPAIPDLSQHKELFKLLLAEKELGIHLTSAYQFVPEYTTAALIVHHPEAVYFRME